MYMCICLRAREKRKADQGFFWGSEKRIQKCCKKFSFGDANCPRPLKKTFGWFESWQERSLFQRGGRLKSSFERKGLLFIWNVVGVLRPPKMTAFRKRGLNVGRECLSGQVTTEKRSTRFVRATLRQPCSLNLEHDCYSEFLGFHGIWQFFERLFCT